MSTEVAQRTCTVCSPHTYQDLLGLLQDAVRPVLTQAEAQLLHFLLLEEGHAFRSQNLLITAPEVTTLSPLFPGVKGNSQGEAGRPQLLAHAAGMQLAKK